VVLLALCWFTSLGSSVAAAQGADQSGDRNDVRIIEVSGLIDAVLTDFLISEIDRAEEQGALAIVLQVDSLGSVVNDDRFTELATRLRDTSVQTAFWVGPSGSAAEGGAAELSSVADIVGVAGGSRIGKSGPARLSAEFGPAFGSATDRLVDQVIGASEALELGIADRPDPSLVTELPTGGVADDPLVAIQSTLPTFLVALEGYDLIQNSDGDTVSSVNQEFLKIPITSQLFHTVASPEITYLFFTGGIALLLFELFTAGVGIAGVLGLLMTLAGTYGLVTLPFRTAGLVCLVLAFLAMAVDIQTNLPRAYTVVGLALFVAGTFLIWDGVTMSWVTGAVGIVGAGLYAYLGMPTMVRTRFSSPVIGRSWLVGSQGIALVDLSESEAGEVNVGDAKWLARAASGSIAAGENIEVVRTRGVRLVVERPLSAN
jgi:membrane-bound serine protease (ClpP class)